MSLDLEELLHGQDAIGARHLGLYNSNPYIQPQWHRVPDLRVGAPQPSIPVPRAVWSSNIISTPCTVSTKVTAEKVEDLRASTMNFAEKVTGIGSYSGTLENLEVHNCRIRVATVRNCLLVNCTVEGSNIADSTLVRCEIVDTFGVNAQPQPRESRIINCYVDLCTLKNSKVFGSKVSKGGLEDCAVQTSIMNGTCLSGSTLQVCEFDNCNLIKTLIFDCVLRSSAQFNCVSKTFPLRFDRFPPEIREILFRLYLGQGIPNIETPTLLVALRGEPILYHEALSVWYKSTVFPASTTSQGRLHYWELSDTYNGHLWERSYTMGHRYLTLGHKAVASMRNAEMGPQVPLLMARSAPYWDRFPIPEALKFRASNLNEINLRCYLPHCPPLAEDFVAATANWVAYFQTINKVTATFYDPLPSQDPTSNSQRIVEAVEKVNSATNTKGFVEMRSVGNHIRYAWKAAPGEFLVWHRDLDSILHWVTYGR